MKKFVKSQNINTETTYYNLFVTSKNKTTNSPIHEFKVLHKGQSLLKPLFNGVLFLIYYFKKHFNPCFFILKTFCSTLNSWIGEFVVSFFDVTNRLKITFEVELAQSMIRQVVMYFSMVRRRACWASLVKWSTSVITTTLNSLSLVVVVICCAELNKMEKNFVKSNSSTFELGNKELFGHPKIVP